MPRRIPLWVERQRDASPNFAREKELRLVTGTVELESDGRFEGQVTSVFPLDDLSSVERQQAEDLILKAERRTDTILRERVLARGGALP